MRIVQAESMLYLCGKQKTDMIRILLLIFFPLGLSANEPDTTHVRRIELQEVTIVGFKREQKEREPLSISSLNNRFLKNNEIASIKELSSLLPNFYMPDYGSKQNAPVYIRGIGSKTNAPSVGFYVDGVPHFEKSAFDIDLSDISNIEVLRGPQGTLYGRNAIGGIINVYTHSPLDYQNTRIKAGYGNHNDLNLLISNYTKLSKTFGFSVSGNYHQNDGFFTNLYTGKKSDNINNGAVRTGIVWKPANNWTLRLNASFDYSEQGGYPYGPYNAENGTVGAVNYNRYSSYHREIFTTGLNIRYEGKNFGFNSQTSYQNISDRQGIDQDFTPADKYYVTQQLRQKMYSQETTLKSMRKGRYQWITGIFTFVQDVHNRVENTLYAQGYSTPKFYDIPVWGIAFYHQSSFHIYKGISLLAGLRYDYEYARDHYSQFKQISGKEPELTNRFDSRLSFNQFTPKLTLQYRSPHEQLFYASLTKGYKTGGFNTSFESEAERTYRPEYNWNYELGTKLTFFNHMLTAELSLFYIDWRNQQITQTIPGVGNILRNAGHSDSKGFEFSCRVHPLPSLSLQLNYGYAYARFLNYIKSEKQNYSGNFLPMVPRHTLSLNGGYTFHIQSQLVDRFTFSAGLTGIGPIYWNEDNKVRQDFYTLLNAKVSASKGWFTWEVWGKNLSDTNYLSYYFVSSGAFAQRGKPITFGASFIINL
ncbi:TonB-dependent receptor plug [Bacteroides helcogenes P 36-108]|uniref:TonB-dependent receptor plug n=2 Tax=Bacteroides helcogenes TaxID=290053 RepID=E6SN58_BACT6|nr:TonB-dependent receptor plug [Bacteroides helcogenes P 36-108]